MEIAFSMLKEFEPFCWFGYGYCPPPPEVIKEATSDEAMEANFISEPQPAQLTLDWMGMEFKPNYENILVLTLVIIISCFTALIVAGCYFLRHRLFELEPESTPQPEPGNFNIPYTEDNNPDDKPPAAAYADSHLNANAATVAENSGGSSLLNTFRGWRPWTTDASNENNALIAERNSNLESTLSEFRRKAVIERVPSHVIIPQHLNSKKRISVRSSNNLLDGSIDPILCFHEIPRKSGVAYGSIQSLKLEAIIRLCGMPYTIVTEFDENAKEPWLTYAGTDYIGIKDCLEVLEIHFPSAFQDYQVSPKKMVPAHCMKTLTECDLFWAVHAWYFFHGVEENVLMNFDYNKSIIEAKYELKNMMRECCRKFHGMNLAKITLEMEKDLEALSESLGNKDFFIGESMTVLDCSIYAGLAHFMWEIVPTYTHFTLKHLIQKHANLTRFCIHIRKQLWKDWKPEALSGHLLSPNKLSEANFEPKSMDFAENDDSKYDWISDEAMVQQNNYIMDKISGMVRTASRLSEHSQAKAKPRRVAPQGKRIRPSGFDFKPKIIPSCN